MNVITDRIKQIQQEFGLNDVQLGAIAGVTKAAVGKWKNHGAVPLGPALVALQEKLGVRGSWLLYGKGPMRACPEPDAFAQTLAGIAKDLGEEAKREILEFACYKASKNSAE